MVKLVVVEHDKIGKGSQFAKSGLYSLDLRKQWKGDVTLIKAGCGTVRGGHRGREQVRIDQPLQPLRGPPSL